MNILANLGLSLAILLVGGLAIYMGAYAFGVNQDLRTWLSYAQMAAVLIGIGLVWRGWMWGAAGAVGLVLLILALLLILSR